MSTNAPDGGPAGPPPDSPPDPPAHPPPDPPVSRDEAASLAIALAGLVSAAHQVLSSGPQSPVQQRISDHLGIDAREATVVAHHWQPWEHVSVHRGVAAHLAEVGSGTEWFGLPGTGMRMHNDLATLLQMDPGGRSSSADFVLLPCSPDETQEVVSFGLIDTVGVDGAPVVLALRDVQMNGPAQVVVEVLAADRRTATVLLERLQALVAEHDVLRGQVLSFTVNEHMGNQLVTFLPRPSIAARDVILPPAVLPTIEKHVAGPAAHAERLRDLGIHLKRGLLLHGPPGTGKTHTVRYLMGRLSGSTIIVLTGNSLYLIEQAAALARRLVPSVVVVEDVDLIAQDRSFTPGGNPALFSLLDAMDGVAADADVTFVLTTNRAAALEEALTQRPGRIDLAVEIPRPDDDGRRRLIELYAGGATVTAVLDPVIAATDGATASAIKELMRRAVLLAIEGETASSTVVLDDAVLAAVTADFTSEAQALSRALLGAGPDSDAASGFPAYLQRPEHQWDLQGQPGPGPGLVPPWLAPGAQSHRHVGGEDGGEQGGSDGAADFPGGRMGEHRGAGEFGGSADGDQFGPPR